MATKDPGSCLKTQMLGALAAFSRKTPLPSRSRAGGNPVAGNWTPAGTTAMCECLHTYATTRQTAQAPGFGRTTENGVQCARR